LSSQVTQLSNEANQPYICPVSNVGWNECGDVGHARYKDDYIRHRKALLNNLANLVRQRDTSIINVNQISNELDRRKQYLDRYAKDFITKQKRLFEVVAQLKIAQDQLTEKARVAALEKFKSRADIFFAENSNDQQQIGSVFGQLEGGA
jgi:hypothetical protein